MFQGINLALTVSWFKGTSSIICHYKLILVNRWAYLARLMTVITTDYRYNLDERLFEPTRH